MGQIFGGVGQIIGSSQQAKAQEQQAVFNAQGLLFNAQAARNDAAQAEKVASANISRTRQSQRRLRGQQKADFAASGVAFDGSVLDVMEDTILQQTLDLQTIEFDGKQRAIALKDQAKLDEFSAANALKSGRAQARATRVGGYVGGASKIASGAVTAVSLFGGV